MCTVVARSLARDSATRLRLRGFGRSYETSQHLDRLQSVLNNAARLVCSARKYDHITPLTALWASLVIFSRTHSFCQTVLDYRCLHGQALLYVVEEFRRTEDIESEQCLSSADTMSLDEPSTKFKTIGDLAFLVAAARIWNRLRHHLRLWIVVDNGE